MASAGSCSLTSALRQQGIKCKSIYANKHYTPKGGDLIINWGNSERPRWHEEYTKNRNTILYFNPVEAVICR